MDSGEIARFIGKRVLIRKLAFLFITVTTLREWYIRSGIRRILKGRANFSLLDAGSGMGQHAYQVAKSFPDAKVVGIEKDAGQVRDCNAFASKTGLKNLTFLQGDLADHKFDPFDAILCCSVLEHIREDRTVLAGFHQALKEDGHLLIYVPTSEKRVLASLARKIHARLKKTGDQFPHEHVRYYTPEELTRKLQETGFTIEERTITYGHYGRLAYDIVTNVQYNSLFKYIFAFYLFLVHPFVLVLMWADYLSNNKEGNGLLIIARK